LLAWLDAEGVSWRVLGNGSNLLIDDAGIETCVIRLGKGFRFLREAAAGEFVVGGATSLMTISRELSDRGYSGLEFAGGIPASLGGAVRMNAGAHGGEMAQVLHSVTAVHGRGETVTLNAADLRFAYRHSELPPGAIVTEARLTLTPGDAQRSAELRAKFLAERKARQPLTVPCAGSIFKNPPGSKSAGALIESTGLKGTWNGGAQVSELHANWIVNPKRTATAAEVLQLITKCQEQVLAQHGVELHPELVVWSG
jgi:UDP-N-acetylmuramate dehydrogenase